VYEEDGVSPFAVLSYLGKLREGFRLWNTMNIKQSSASASGVRLILKSDNVAHLGFAMSVSLPVHTSSNNNSITAPWIFIGINILDFHYLLAR
jgi:hypothetical protein